MKIVIADDHPLFREALAARIARLFPGAEIIEVASLDEAFMVARDGEPGMFLLDYHMPGVSDESLQQLVQHFPGARVAIISGTADPEDVHRVIRSGVHGFLPKTCSSDYLQHALNMLLAGGTSVPTEYLLTARPAAPEPDDVSDWAAKLSERETQVMIAVARGLPNKAIAYELGIAEVTVKVHLSSIFRKTGARTRSEAAVLATKARLG